MSRLEKIYHEIYGEMTARNEKKILAGELKIDQLIKSDNDTRKGLAVFGFVNNFSSAEYLNLLRILERDFSEQVIYYPVPIENSVDKGLLHFTFIQFVGVIDSVPLEFTDNVSNYADVVRDALLDMGAFTIKYTGVIAIPSGLLLKGIPSVNINKFREKIRDLVEQRKLCLKEPYKTDIVHSTVLRLAVNTKPKKLLSVARRFQDVDLGTAEMQKLYLGFGSWAMRAHETKALYEIDLVAKKISRL